MSDQLLVKHEWRDVEGSIHWVLMSDYIKLQTKNRELLNDLEHVLDWLDHESDNSSTHGMVDRVREKYEIK